MRSSCPPPVQANFKNCQNRKDEWIKKMSNQNTAAYTIIIDLKSGRLFKLNYRPESKFQTHGKPTLGPTQGQYSELLQSLARSVGSG